MSRGCNMFAGLLVSLCIPVVSCVSEETGTPSGLSDEVIFRMDEIQGLTRSSLAADECKVKSLKIFAYSDGVLDAEEYFTSFTDMSMRLEMGKTYDFYALANVGDVEVPLLESEVSNLACSLSWGSDYVDSFPMSWCMKGRRVVSGSSVNISLSRLVAKITLDVECGNTGLHVSSVALKQVPMKVRPFAETGSRVSEGEVSCGDHSSDADVRSLNEGGVACFYMLENMQGTLLPGNTDPMLKVPGRLPAKADVCTYIEVECAFDEGDDREGSVSYRMYLGKDNVSNFDVARNQILSLSLKLTDGGIGIRDSWKVISDYIQHVTSLRLDRNNVDMYAGDEAHLIAEVLPSDAGDKSVSWVSDNTDVAVVDPDGLVRAVGKGSCIVRAVGADRPDVSAECVVNVLEPYVVSMEFSTTEVSAVLGADGKEKSSYFNVVAVYSDGSSAVVTNQCSYSCGSSSVRVDHPGIVTHVSEGETVVVAELDGVKAFMTAYTENLAAVGVELQADNVVVSLGETFVMRYRVQYNDGSVGGWIAYGYLSGYGFSADGWTCSELSVADVNQYGVVSPRAKGLAEVSVSVCGPDGTIYTASASVEVTDAYVTDVRAEMSPMFYSGSSGPVLIGVYSDGSESPLKADSWSVSSPYVKYSESGGIVISDEDALMPGATICGFTARYGDFTASVSSIYGKWVLDTVLEKEYMPGYDRYLLRMCLIYADLTREYVGFEYELSSGGGYWTQEYHADESGALVDWTWPYVRARTALTYYDSSGSTHVWTAELK